MGPNKEATARMIMQDVEEKVMNLERIKLLPVQDAMVVLRRTASACGDILDHHQVTGPINTNLMGLGPLPARIII